MDVQTIERIIGTAIADELDDMAEKLEAAGAEGRYVLMLNDRSEVLRRAFLPREGATR